MVNRNCRGKYLYSLQEFASHQSCSKRLFGILYDFDRKLNWINLRKYKISKTHLLNKIISNCSSPLCSRLLCFHHSQTPGRLMEATIVFCYSGRFAHSYVSLNSTFS